MPQVNILNLQKMQRKKPSFGSRTYNGQKPEYYITGQYELVENQLKLKNIFISSDVYSQTPIKFTIENVEAQIDQNTYNVLDVLDREIKPFANPIIELLNLKSRGHFFDYTFVKGKEVISNTSPFLINADYTIELDIKKSTFFYAVFVKRP